MRKYLLLCLIGLLSWSSFAHSPNLSTTMLVEKSKGVWVLQISTSLTAFKQEIRTHFKETPYQSPEEFQEMVLEHITNHLYLRFNGDTTISLDKGIVKLGHETVVVFEVKGIPEEIQSVFFKNTAFQDIHRNKGTFMLFKEGFLKDQFTINNTNEHRLNLEVKGNQLIDTNINSASVFSPYLVFIILALFGSGFMIRRLFLKTN